TAIMINPIPYLTAAGGLYFESQIFEIDEANVMMKNEFRIENHDGSISEASLVYSLYNIQIATHQTKAKVIIKTIFVMAALFHVCFANKNNTHEIKIKGIIVSNVFSVLNIVSEVPSNDRSTLSRANKTNDDAACSKLIQKKIVKNANIITAIIRSRTTFSYRINREIINPIKMIKPIIISKYIPLTISNPMKDKSKEGKKSIPPITYRGASKANNKPTIVVKPIKM